MKPGKLTTSSSSLLRTVFLVTGVFLLLFTSASAWSQAAVVDSGLKQPIIRYDSIHHSIKGRFGMVVSQNSIATKVGQEILARGGNAVDASVAVGFALAVTLPRAGNLGGSGFMLAHMAKDKKTVAYDYRSVAPQTASIEKFSNADGELNMDRLTFGPMAPAVPGTVAGLYTAWQQFGSMPWKDILQPAY